MIRAPASQHELRRVERVATSVEIFGRAQTSLGATGASCVKRKMVQKGEMKVRVSANGEGPLSFSAPGSTNSPSPGLPRATSSAEPAPFRAVHLIQPFPASSEGRAPFLPLSDRRNGRRASPFPDRRDRPLLAPPDHLIPCSAPRSSPRSSPILLAAVAPVAKGRGANPVGTIQSLLALPQGTSARWGSPLLPPLYVLVRSNGEGETSRVKRSSSRELQTERRCGVSSVSKGCSGRRRWVEERTVVCSRAIESQRDEGELSKLEKAERETHNAATSR